MPTLVATREVGTGGIASNVTTLSISWLSNHFAAAAIHHGVVEGRWEREAGPDVSADLSGLIREAVLKTNYRGSSASVVLANAQLAQQLIDVPPARGADLRKIIQREAQQQKLFSGEAVWTFQSSLVVKGVQRVILHLMPKTLRDQFINACQQNGLHLNSLTPVSAVLQQQLAQLPLEKGDVAMLAAETGGYTTVVVGRADGQLLLVRTLLSNWRENPERLVLDLKRTTSFVTQQYGLNINRGVWLFGPGAAEQAQPLQQQLEMPALVSPVLPQPFYWATEAAKLRPASGPNFIGLELQQAPQRRIFARVVAAATAVIVVISLLAAVVLLQLARQETTNLEILRKHAAQLQTQRQELAQRNAELDGQAQLVKLVVEDRQPPVPVWLLGYLGEAVPPELVVTNFQVKWDENMWKLRLAGTFQTSSLQPADARLSTAVSLLADRLADGPFHVTIMRRSDRPEPGPYKVNAFGNGPVSTVATNQFSIEGVMP